MKTFSFYTTLAYASAILLVVFSDYLGEAGSIQRVVWCVFPATFMGIGTYAGLVPHRIVGVSREFFPFKEEKVKVGLSQVTPISRKTSLVTIPYGSPGVIHWREYELKNTKFEVVPEDDYKTVFIA